MKRIKYKKDRSVPKYNGFLFLLFPLIIYAGLNLSLVGSLFVDELMELGTSVLTKLPAIESAISENPEFFESNEFEQLMTPEENAFNEKMKLLFIRDNSTTFFFVGLFIFLFNLPIKNFFRRKRAGKKIGTFSNKYTKALINYSPEIIGGIVLLGLLNIQRSLFFMLRSLDSTDEMFSIIRNILIISIFTSTLGLLLVYFGQKFRVQTKYIHHVYSSERLQRLPRGFNFPGLKGRFFMTTVFLTFVPLVITLFYVVSSFTLIEDLNSLDPVKVEILFGDLFNILRAIPDGNGELAISEVYKQENLPYMDGLSSIQLLFGIATGLFFTIIYVLKMIQWSNVSILKPIKELLRSMKSVSKGNLDSYTVVRSREETGQLSNGFNQMLDGLKERERIKSLFGQYLSAEISEEILNGNVDLNGSMYKATILFADIRGFTALSETITPHETISFLNEYYNVLIGVVHQYGGIIDKFMGDGILVLFGVPIASKDHADRAVEAAFTIQKRLEDFNNERVKNGIFTVKIGIGIHTGDVIAGNVGNSNKLEYTVIGDTVNVASRIESLTKKFETDLLIGESVHQSLSPGNLNKNKFQKLDGVTLRGKRLKVNLLKLIS
ncbi:MAG: adenylate/guanylate cyclase domain-containing protein [Spirochaetaceae bacterium]